MKLIIADDHQMMLDGIKDMINTQTDHIIAGEAGNGQVAYELIAAHPERYELLLTDISMPLLSGTELCKMIKDQFPHIQVLILSMYDNPVAIKEAILAEADGYILKSAGREELIKAINRVGNGGTYFSEAVLPLLHRQYHQQKSQDQQLKSLTEREIEILRLIIQEYTSDEIAKKLFISKKTVDNHRQHILEKTNSKSTVGLVKFAIKTGLCDDAKL